MWATNGKLIVNELGPKLETCHVDILECPLKVRKMVGFDL